MAPTNSFLDFIKETFSPFGSIAIRKMFGGAGAYCDGLFFAIIADDEIYFKVDDETRPVFESAGLSPFVFDMKDGRSGVMSYHRAPDDIFDDHDELTKWTSLALDAARRAAAKKKPSSKKGRQKTTRKKTAKIQTKKA